MLARTIFCACMLLPGGEECTELIIKYLFSTVWYLKSQESPGSTGQSSACHKDRAQIHLLGRDPEFSLCGRSSNVSNHSPMQGGASQISNCTQSRGGCLYHRFHSQVKSSSLLSKFNLHDGTVEFGQFTVFRQELDRWVMVWGLHCLHQGSQSELPVAKSTPADHSGTRVDSATCQDGYEMVR